MTRQIIRTSEAPTSAMFSQAIKVGSTLYVSGTVGIDPKTNQLAGSTIQEQTRQALINCEKILRAAGATLENVVEVLVLQPGRTILPALMKSMRNSFPAIRRRVPSPSSVLSFRTFWCRSR